MLTYVVKPVRRAGYVDKEIHSFVIMVVSELLRRLAVRCSSGMR